VYWIYALPIWLLALILLVVITGLTAAAHRLIRPRVRRLVTVHHDWNHVLGHVLANYGVLYGVLLALVALATFENHADVENVVSREAASLAALFRDVSSYPEPARAGLRASLRDYGRYVIEEEWPALRKGIVPGEGTERITAFQERLAAFEPGTKGQEIVHGAGVHQFNLYVEARRERLHAAATGLPAVWWYVVAIGAVLGILLMAGFLVENATAHLALSLSLNLLVGAIVFLLVVTDHPLRGGVAITADAFEVVQLDLMKPGGD
jgi:uncharacterized protein involved in cysteine biosynthesis